MSATTAADELHIEAEKLARAILTRRRIKCERVQQHHTDGGKCPNCGA